MAGHRQVKIRRPAPQPRVFSVDTTVMSSIDGLTAEVLEQAILTALQSAGFSVPHIACQEVVD